MDPVFTYQGQLKEGGVPYNGVVYLEFTLWDAPISGTQIGDPYWTFDGVPVTDGLFTVEVDAMLFGPTAFTGEPRWLQVVITDWNYFDRTELSPRQPINPAPYALFALDGAGGGGGSVWQVNGGDIYYGAGNVGIGTTSPERPLHVVSSAASSIYGENDRVMGRGVKGEGTAPDGNSIGVEGRAASTGGTGVYGYASSQTGEVYGVSGSTRSPDGASVYGHNFAPSGGKAIHGWCAPKCAPNDGYAGFFEGGRNYFEGYVGIGTTDPNSPLTVNGVVESQVGGFKFPDGSIQMSAAGGGGTTLWSQGIDDSITYNDGFVGIWLIGAPTEALDVGGTVKMNGLRLGDSATPGHVLTADANGVGTWQPASGGGSSLWAADTFGISYLAGNVGIGAASTSGNALNIRGAGARTLQAHNTATSGFTSAIWGESQSTMGAAVYGHAGAGTGYATGVFGEAASPDGYGVQGYNDDDSGTGDAVGVYGTSSSPTGVGVKGEVYGPGGLALWGRNEGTSGHALLAEATATSGATFGVEAYAASPDGYGISSFNEAESGDAIAVYGETASPTGFAGYFLGKGYFSENVGIGTSSPGSKLTVAGLVESTTAGFKFPDGSIQTTAATGGGGDTVWQAVGSEIHYDAGNVGVGVADPQVTLHVAGGHWDVSGGEGDFKIGDGVYRLKMGVATGGVGAGHSRIFAGGPSSKLTLGANGTEHLTVTGSGVGIDTTSPSAALDVAGTFRLRTAAAEGYVLTSDAQGYATWQPGGSGGSFDLPYAGTITFNGSALSVTNSGTTMATHAVSGVIDNAASGDASAGFFSAVGSGMAIHAESDGGRTIYAHNSGGGRAVEGQTSGSGGGYFTSSMNGGYGVKGVSSSAGTSPENRGGWFTASGNLSIGVDVEGGRYGVRSVTPQATGCAVRAEATGASSTGVVAVSPNDGIHAEGGRYAGRFMGRVIVYPYGGGDVIFAVNNDGITQVDVLQIMGGADLSEQFDVTGTGPPEPGSVMCIDAVHPGKLVVCDAAYDRRVAGIISGAGGIEPGMMMGQRDTVADGAHPVALTGRVYVLADAQNGPIEPGDMLTSSSVPGHAMKVTAYDRAHGATIGKAMTGLEQGRGLVLVLVSLQ